MPVPLKRYSQNWLANAELAAALARDIQPRSGEHFLEIGPGDGRLTRALLEHAVRVTAIEIDPRCCSSLRELAAERQPAALEVLEANVLDVDPAGVAAPGSGAALRFVGNLPYAISSPILRWTVRHREHVIDAHYMLPAEIAERLVAPPGSSARGLITVVVEWFFAAEIVRRLGPGSFRPAPKIDSAFVRLSPITPPACTATPPQRQAVVRAAFAHRRKTVRNNLLAAGWQATIVDKALQRAEVVAASRAEALSVEQFAALSEALPERKP